MELETSLLIAGRILLASLFICAGIKHCFLAKVIVPMIATRGIPYPRAVCLLGSAFEFAAGALLALGIEVFWASLGLAAFTIGATVMLVNFWDMEGPPREQALMSFQYNVAIVGGLLIAAASAM
jgi:putative oxidoreductase